jgi:hypothetical protein
MNFSSRRSNSATSGASHPPRAWSFKRQAQQPPPPKKNELIRASYSVYNLKWEKLKDFLENKFPNNVFEECHVCVPDCSLGTSLAEDMSSAYLLISSNQVLEDRHYFEIPKPLTAVGFPVFLIRPLPPCVAIKWWLMGHLGGHDSDREFAGHATEAAPF